MEFLTGAASLDASLDASVEEYDAILVSLIAEVVTAYLNGEFTRFWAYDATTKALKEMTAQVPGGEQGPGLAGIG